MVGLFLFKYFVSRSLMSVGLLTNLSGGYFWWILLNYSSLFNSLSRNIRTGSSLKIHYSRWNKISYFTLPVARQKKRNITKQEKFFIKIHAQRYRNTESKTQQKRKFKLKQQQISRSKNENMKSTRFSFGFSFGTIQRAKAELWKMLMLWMGCGLMLLHDAFNSENWWKMLWKIDSHWPSCCLFIYATALNTIQRYTSTWCSETRERNRRCIEGKVF